MNHNERSVNIHPTAIVASDVQIGMGVQIGPYSVIGNGVELGDEVWIGPHVVISGITHVGAQTKIHASATIGSAPQDLKYKDEPTKLVIGRNNNIREYVNISRGTMTGGGETTIGDNNLIMVYCHIAHDCKIGNHTILSNSVHLAGHVTVADRAVFGGMAGGHQFTRFGECAMIAAGSVVVQDVAPFCLVKGDRAEIHGLNAVGLRRAGVTGEALSNVKKMFRLFFRENLTVEEAVQKIESSIPSSRETKIFLEFVKTSKRGLCR